MGVRSTAAFLGVVAVAGLFAACASTPEGPVAPEVRRAEVLKVEITEQTFTEFTGVIHVQVDPGSDAGLVADAADWNVSLKGEPIAKGRAELGQPIPAGGTVLQIPFRSAYAANDEALGALLEKPTSLPGFYQGAVLASVGPKKIEFAWSHSAFVRSPRVPRLKMFHVEAAKFHEQKEIALVFFVDVENPNPFEIKFQGIDYDLVVDGKPIVQKGLAGVNAKVPPGSAARIEIPVSLVQDNFKDIDRLIKQPTSVPYKIDGDARLGLGHIPFELEGPIDLGAGTVKHAAD
jgi:LEA14-like dessication related protein